MNAHSTHRAAPAILAALALVVQPIAARAEAPFTIPPEGNSHVGTSEDSIITGSANGDLIFGDPAVGTGSLPASVVRLSTGRDSTGTPGKDTIQHSFMGSYINPFSPDGNKILITTEAANLVPDFPGVLNVASQAYVRNLVNVYSGQPSDSTDYKALSLIGRSPGTPGNGNTQGAIYSPDGTKVALSTVASNLTGGGAPGVIQIVV